MKNKWKEYLPIGLTGVAFGALAIMLTAMGNPANMGFCIACFVRDIAGALGLHQAAAVQYLRPEIFGIVLGALLMSLFKKEFRARGGSSPATRFFIGMFVMIGALMFLGCPLRMVLRLGGGDLNALVGLVGFAAGILLGIFALKKGFTLQRAYPQNKPEGFAFPVFMVAVFAIGLLFPTLLQASADGPGSKHAPILIALFAGLVAGALAQRSRMCFVGGIRDAVMFQDYKLLTGFGGILVTILLYHAITGTLRFGFLDQPVAHTDGLWNFLGMLLVGWGSVLVGGCPLRQLILAGEGNSDSAVTVLGLLFGGAIAHTLGLASSAAGPTANGQAAVILGLLAMALLSIGNRKKI